MALTKISTDGFKDDAVTTDKLANAINTERTANTAKDLTALSAANLTSGTIPDARFPATLPAASAANLTAVPAANITGTLPAISGANLTGISTTPADGSITQAKLNFPVANRNLIINGAMQVAQRGTSSTTANTYSTVDRNQIRTSGVDEAPTIAQVDVASGTTPYTLGFRKAFKITNGNQTGGAGAADFIWWDHRLEAQDIANSGWNYTSSSSYITLSFWIKSSVAQTFKGYLRSIDGTAQQYPFETGSLTADTWTKITKSIPGNSNLTFDDNNDFGLQINILAFYGTDVTDNSVTENAWSAFASSARMKDNTSTWYTTNDATLEITGVQLEVGSVATDFEHRSFAQELQLCKRYFQNHAPVSGDHMMWGVGRAESNTGRIGLPVSVPMRAAPTVYAAKNRLMKYDGNASDSTSTPSVFAADSSWLPESNIYTLDFGGHSLAHNNMYMLTCSADSKITLSSEL
jgi:hypothetical protein